MDPSLLATNWSASSQVDSTKIPFLRINGLVKRSSLFIKSQPNFPLIQVEIALTGASEVGWTFKIFRSFVQISKEHPTPQNVQTVFVFFVLVSRIADSISEIARIPLYPGSTFLTISIIGFNKSSSSPDINPASPNMDFSIKALQGQIVTHWPQLTQEESLI